ncbi:MAG: tRNA (N(6)-L-threonylcarbamoyladenosine(37)-C(2))-methylthiotransferase MtaB [Desulfococcaceae bacterium]
MVKRFVLATLGCKVNQCESEGIAQALSDAGWAAAKSGAPADLVVVNTCTVTGRAAMQSRGAIRQAVRKHPEARIVVTGCHAQTEAELLSTIPGVAAVVGHADKHRIPELADGFLSDFTPGPEGESPGPRVLRRDLTDYREFFPAPALAAGERTRPFLKIQDGCDAFCTYCIVPYARGRSRSMRLGSVLERIAALADANVRETVLTGIHLGRWGRDLDPPISLADLLRKIEAQGRMDRVRLSSIESHELTDELLEVVAGSDRFCDHLHIPLQSGDDDVLRRMGRPYTAAEYAERVRRAAKVLPDAAFGADVLVGFPGEEESAFRNTCDLVESLPATYLHVFPFSPRQGTQAAGFPDPVPSDVIKERCRVLRELGAAKRAAFYRRFAGRTVSVLVEDRPDRETGNLKGVSGNYLTVLLEETEGRENQLVKARIDRVEEAVPRAWGTAM